MELKLTNSESHHSHTVGLLWSKHGLTILLIHGPDPPSDITVFVDVSRNPGPDVSVTTSAMVETMQQCDFSAYNLYASLELPNKALNVCHYNVCSLTNKLDEIKLLLSTISSRSNGKSNFILAMSETLLNGSWSDASHLMVNYNIHRLDSAVNKGGGLLVYIPLHLPINGRTDLEVQGIECICLELHFPRSKPWLF